MTLDSTILRELGASTRTFQGIRHALLWYRDELSRRLSMARAYETGWAPRTRESVDRANATFAAIAACLKGPRRPILWLVAWYEHTEGDGTWLAEQAGMNRWAFGRYVRRTERRVQRRLEAAGLVEGEN